MVPGNSYEEKHLVFFDLFSVIPVLIKFPHNKLSSAAYINELR